MNEFNDIRLNASNEWVAKLKFPPGLNEISSGVPGDSVLI